jgi:hypothetical protein
MVNSIKVFGLIIVLLLLHSCGNEKKTKVESTEQVDTIVKRWFYDDNWLQAKQQFVIKNDSLIASGYRKEYFENGRGLHAVAWYSNNLQQGHSYIYDTNARLQKHFFYFMGHQVGNQYEYHSDGKTIKSILHCLGHDGCNFEISYSPAGRILNVQGVPLYVYGNYNEHLGLGDTLFFLNRVVKIDGIETVLRITLSDSVGKLRDETIKDFLFWETGNTYAYNLRIAIADLRSAKCNYKAIISLQDSTTGKLIKEDTVFIPINVKVAGN